MIQHGPSKIELISCNGCGYYRFYFGIDVNACTCPGKISKEPVVYAFRNTGEELGTYQEWVPCNTGLNSHFPDDKCPFKKELEIL